MNLWPIAACGPVVMACEVQGRQLLGGRRGRVREHGDTVSRLARPCMQPLAPRRAIMGSRNQHKA
jgi:hypothetical protein